MALFCIGMNCEDTISILIINTGGRFDAALVIVSGNVVYISFFCNGKFTFFGMFVCPFLACMDINDQVDAMLMSLM